jgi:hypothetical protein
MWAAAGWWHGSRPDADRHEHGSSQAAGWGSAERPAAIVPAGYTAGKMCGTAGWRHGPWPDAERNTTATTQTTGRLARTDVAIGRGFTKGGDLAGLRPFS